MRHSLVRGMALVMSAAAISGVLSVARPSGALSAATGAGTRVIALSNSFIGNSWRKKMVGDFTQVAREAMSKGQIKDFVVVNADNTVSQQLAEMDGLILKHVGAIVLDAASPTALNGVIAKAHQVGIPVVSFDGTVTSPDSYNVFYDFVGLGKHIGTYIAQRLKGKGNVLTVRGVAGTIIDTQEYQGWTQALSGYPNIKVVGTVYGNWDDATAQSAVARILPSLPRVDAVIIDGGGFGVAQAFAAAKRPTPIIYLGNRGSELQWWWKEHQRNGYTTESSSTAPGSSTAAFWVAVNLLKGVTFPHQLQMQFLTITQADLARYKDLPFNDVADTIYTNAWVLAHFPHSP
jgi:ribose transport system substrate-binding protein